MTDISEDDIRARAYALWVADGRPEGSHEAHWLQAVRELTAEAAAGAAISKKPSGTSKLSVVKNDQVVTPVARKRGKVI